MAVYSVLSDFFGEIRLIGFYTYVILTMLQPFGQPVNSSRAGGDAELCSSSGTAGKFSSVGI